MSEEVCMLCIVNQEGYEHICDKTTRMERALKEELIQTYIELVKVSNGSAKTVYVNRLKSLGSCV